MQSQVDFGYAPIYVYGHLIITAIAAPLLYLALKRKWPKLLTGGVGALALWSFAAFAILNFVAGINSCMKLPTEQFFKAGEGLVLDMGAGSGRSALMVLDTFAESYTEHFHEDSAAGQARLLANLRSVGVANEPPSSRKICVRLERGRLRAQGSLAGIRPGGDFAGSVKRWWC